MSSRTRTGKWSTAFPWPSPSNNSAEGYRRIWCQSTRKAAFDALTRHQQVERALLELPELRLKLSSPRTRYRQREKVVQAVASRLEARGVTRWIIVAVVEQTEETFRQERRIIRSEPPSRRNKEQHKSHD